MNVISKISRELFGKLYGDKGHISSHLFSMLFDNGVHLVTGIRSNMNNQLTPLYNKIMLCKRSVIETINDELKNICQIEHSRHRSPVNFLINLLAGIGAYCFFDKKPAIKFDKVVENKQLFCSFTEFIIKYLQSIFRNQPEQYRYAYLCLCNESVKRELYPELILSTRTV